jgi:crotonobetainyl-CoA:carnitine CoA-transferase CaiB-like acyl-CoA transferase
LAAVPSDARSPPLEGIVVADFSRVLAAPLCAMLLGDLGAEVIKVERPEGDDTRAWGPPWAPHGGSTYFDSVNRNKRSVTLDLRDPGDLELARRLCARADVLIENFAPGTMSRLGLDHDELLEANPRLVLCSVTGFGASAELPGYDLLAQAVGGLMSVTGEPDGPPTKVGVAVVDVICGLFATVGILAALRERERSGRGQRVEVSLLASVLTALVNLSQSYVGAGLVPARVGSGHPSVVPYQTFAVADGEVVVAVGNDRQFARLCAEIGVGELAQDARFAANPDRVANRDALLAQLVPRFRVRARAELVGALGAAGVPCGPVNDLADAFALAERLGLHKIVEMADGARQVADPIELSASPVSYRRPPPPLGADDFAVREWLRGEDDGFGMNSP